MQDNFYDSLARVEGFEVLNGLDSQELGAEGDKNSSGTTFFKVGDIKFRAHQFKASALTISVIVTTFSFPATKKLDKNRILGFINDFNSGKPGLKANLAKADGKGFVVNFSVDLIAPNEQISDEMVHSALRLLRGSGRLLLRDFFEKGFFLELRPKK
ncbi:hypothetical protein [Pseudomonas sp. 52 E 6]|uniref:hypothetical protein n=1 Tax=Pseudomonas sp. 52 E 6 TaxID=1844106 RepID=UPI00081BDAFD|nr:hypothetical protein [Pseudomonas sp. 52 E 6]